MSWFYRHVARPVLFTQDSEFIHDKTLAGLGAFARLGALHPLVRGFLDVPSLPTQAFGLKFPNPVGLAAGMDKRAVALPVWETFGFGFSEMGGVTWHGQPGNPKPRMFRAVAEEALINRMGFNNGGAPAMAEQLAMWKTRGLWPSHPVGINLGKSKVTPNDEAIQDYANSFKSLWALADFFVVNVSSPNTPNLRQLQDKSALDAILVELNRINQSLAQESKSAPKPILVKVAPDLTFEALDEILELAVPRALAGIVATNTTLARPQTVDAVAERIYRETGGLSGRPLTQRSTEVIRHLYRASRGSVPIIGVGGIFNAQDAWEKITAGASLVQIYSGLVYEGPGVVREVVMGLRDRLREAGLRSVSEAVGLNQR